MKTRKNPREEIISLMRGFFVCPIISFFHNHDLIDKITNTNFKVETFKKIKNKNFLLNIFLYLVSLDLLVIVNNKKYIFKSSKLGKKIFKRSGSFLLIHSYKPFVNELNRNLFFEKKLKISCDRAENVKGSGSTNNKKFFPSAINLFNKKEVGLVADIGCGDGNFLTQVTKKIPNIPLFASDISKIAVNASKKNLVKFKTKKFFLVCDAFNVKKWAKEINKIKIEKNKKIIISIWYILHEISQNNPKRIINFFYEIKKNLPNASILIGEITRFNHSTLSKNKSHSIMPEFLFFHELSGQGILKYEDFNYILKRIPYKIKNNISFDYIKEKNKKIPSAFIWYLT